MKKDSAPQKRQKRPAAKKAEPKRDYTLVKYTVQKPFKHSGREYKQGDEFIPGPGRWDRLIAEQRCTSAVEVIQL